MNNYFVLGRILGDFIGMISFNPHNEFFKGDAITILTLWIRKQRLGGLQRQVKCSR
jgi:hypothetical protein